MGTLLVLRHAKGWGGLDQQPQLWLSDGGKVTLFALQPLQKHHCDHQREPVVAFPAWRGAWPASMLLVEEVFHDYH